MTTSKMRAEVAEIPAAVDRLLTHGVADIAAAAAAVRARNPAFVVTVARGSSDHACTYLKYACELLTGRPVASLGPSIASIYGASLRLDPALCISVSQSGQSPDIVAMAQTARRDGALCVALTNDPDAPLGQAADFALDIHAGPELSVAATKSFVTSAVAGLMILAHWQQNADLIAALHGLPGVLDKAVQIDWPQVRAAVGPHASAFTLGRGPSWGIAAEAALKFKEVCQIHAESYSSAEVVHGPISLVDPGFPVLAFAAADKAEDPIAQIADTIAGKGAAVFATSDRVQAATRIDHIRTAHPLTDPISLITSFYAMIEADATARGIDPDTPRHLRKVTETV